MLRTKSFYISIIIIGTCLFATAVLSSFLFEMSKSIAGLLIGIGTLCLAYGAPKFITKYYETTKPELMKQNQIELDDERNTMIRNKAKARSSDMIDWFIMGMIFIAILYETITWMFFAIVGVYMLKHIAELVYTIKYQKEL